MNWYCLHVKPLKEAAVASHCRDILGLEVYFPRLRKCKTIRRQRVSVTGALFPRYIFARFDLARFFRSVRYAPHMIDVVHCGGQPAVVDEALISELKSWAGTAVDVVTLPTTLRSGDLVELTDGPMRGISGIILDYPQERDRVAILLSFLQHGAYMTVDRSQIRPVAV